ncbi:MAG: CAP domain-containing protein [Anaerolineales bacterium]
MRSIVLQHLLLSLLITSCGLFPGSLGLSMGPTESAVQVDLQPLATEMLIETNRTRMQEGVPPLIAHTMLMSAAETRAADMAQLGYFDHIHPLRGTAEIERLLRPEFPGGRIAELVYRGDGSLDDLPGQALLAWMADTDNRRVLLDPDYQWVGAGLQREGSYWMAVLVLVGQAQEG